MVSCFLFAFMLFLLFATACALHGVDGILHFACVGWLVGTCLHTFFAHLFSDDSSDQFVLLLIVVVKSQEGSSSAFTAFCTRKVLLPFYHYALITLLVAYLPCHYLHSFRSLSYCSAITYLVLIPLSPGATQHHARHTHTHTHTAAPHLCRRSPLTHSLASSMHAPFCLCLPFASISSMGRLGIRIRQGLYGDDMDCFEMDRQGTRKEHGTLWKRGKKQAGVAV